jgi:hypothetical protein
MSQDLQIDEKEDVRKLHASLIRLLIDSKEFESFQQSPIKYAEKLGNVPISYKQLVSRINLDGLKIFRNIVQGTRQERFRQVFSTLHTAMHNESAWDSLIADFLARVVVKNGRDDTDLFMFETYTRQWQNTVIADLCAFDRAVYTASNSPPVAQELSLDVTIHKQFRINPWVEKLETTRSAKALSCLPVAELENQPEGNYVTLIYLTTFDQSLRLRALGQDVAQLFKQNTILTHKQLTDLVAKAPIVQKLIDEGAIGAVANV